MDGIVGIASMLWYFFLATLIIEVPQVCPMQDSLSKNTVVDEGNQLLKEFYSRYNATKEVDLVFVLDRSGSVPVKGWASMLSFVEKVLEHFTVDKDNTRVAVVTFSTTASVDINDLDIGNSTIAENKCTLFSRLRDKVETKMCHGYTATTDALQKTFNILLNSRPNSKKAVLILTDGKSNIGPPPVKIAFDILSLRWNLTWDIKSLGPQVEVYAFGIENGYIPELRSIASNLPGHVFMIPKFSLFADFARSLHGGLQEEHWLPTEARQCGSTCNSTFAQCTCGSKIGVYACACSPGYEMVDGVCTACPLKFYKDNYRPEKCVMCPDNTTTVAIATAAKDYCILLPGHKQCSQLPDIVNGRKFQVTGRRQDEVLNTGVNCNGVRDGNSCHYECDIGFRLNGPPVMVCNHDGLWEGEIPSCNVIDCHEVVLTLGPIEGSDVVYKHNHTLFGAEIDVRCHMGRVPLPDVTTWSCDHHGRWTTPFNFQCAEVFCSALRPPEFMMLTPADCAVSEQPHGTICNIACADGFVLQGQASKSCSFTNRALWEPETWSTCKDIQSPVIICPDNVEVTVPNFNQNYTKIHTSAYQNPVVSDNSWIRGEKNYIIQGVPEEGRFPVGLTVLRYVAIDADSNTMNCTQNVHVIAKTADIEQCPADISKTGRSMEIIWHALKFFGADGTSLPHACTPSNGSIFTGPDNEVVCYPEWHPDVQCVFKVSVTPKDCPLPGAPPPAHGSLACGINEHLQKVCRIMCEKGYSMRDLSKQQFRCRDDGTWNPELGNWPACSKTGWGRNVLIAQSMHIRYSGSCADNSVIITDAFKATMEHILTNDFGPCTEEHLCTVQDVIVLCGASRRRRNVAGYGFEDSSKFVRKTNDKPQRGVLQLEHGSSIIINAELKRTETQRHKRSEDGVIIQFALNVQKDSENISRGDQAIMLSTLQTVMNNISAVVDTGELTFDIDGEQYVADVVETMADMPEFRLNCSDRQVPVLNMENVDDMSARCITCAPGSYLSDDDCVLCPNNTYQSEEGQSDCMPCPPDTATVSPGAWNISQCRSRCEEGSYSSTGYEPCTACSIGQYQPYPQQMFCSACPDNTTTAHSGANHIKQCGVLCPYDEYSKTGLEPCIVCPPGTYQSENGQVSCVTCDYDNPTQTMEEWCSDPISCTDWNTDCVNGLCVLSRTNNTICRCHIGYHGDACELDIDDCSEDACLHGGRCHDVVNGVFCECAVGYSGTSCEHYIGLCSQEPCYNNASCVDQGPTFMCICAEGYNGTLCSEELEACSTDPCIHGTCVADKAGLYCECDLGYGGTNCQKAIDYCANITCHNWGTCTRQLTDFLCTCIDGFTGEICEKAIDYCTPDPCHDNGRCINAMTSYYCTCYDGFYGRDCLLSADPGFDLSYQPNNFGYVELPLWEKFHNISVCLWMRSSDNSNYGTILSYAAESNWITTSYIDVFTLYDYNNLQIIINGESIATNKTFNDGNWHHICITWMGRLGVVHIYINGSTAGAGLVAKETHLEGKGTLVIGQRQLGRLKKYFDGRDSFVGSISQLNIYNHMLEKSTIEYLANSSHCVPGLGNAMAWTSVLHGVHGDLGVESRCLDPNECLEPDICEHFEYCVDQNEGYECRPCPSGGCPDRPAPLDSCSSWPCQNGATCVPVHNMFRCICPPEFAGNTCELLVSTCELTTCYHGGTCHEAIDGVYCTCQPPWRGRHCLVMYQPLCAEQPCLNGGNCTQDDITGTYSCTCPHDGRKYGENCEVLSPCELSPDMCISGATCVVLENDNVTCLCPPGFDGEHCYFVAPVTTPIDYCHNIQCQHGGTCQNVENGFRCSCHKDYVSVYCDEQRQIENRIYDVSVSLKKKYTPNLKHNEVFKENIKKQVHSIYANEIGESKLRVDIVDIRQGSVEVDMTLHHTVYIDDAAPGPKEMEHIMYNELQKGEFGNMKASTTNFKFNFKGIGILGGWVLYLLIAVAVLTVFIIVLVTICIAIRKKQRWTPDKLNNLPMCDINRAVNPAFEGDSAPPTPRMRNIHEDNIYDDLNEPSPYAIDLCSGGKDSDPDLTKRFPSKHGRDINKDWASWQRQSIPLPPKPGEIAMSSGRGQENSGDYLQACKGRPPPSYGDVHMREAQERYGRRNLNVDSEYILPMTAEEERYGLDKDLYLKPSEMRKDNISKATGLHIYINTQGAEATNEEEQPTYLPLLPNTPEGASTSQNTEQSEPGPDSAPESTEAAQATREASPDYLLLNEEIPVSNFEAPKPIMRAIRKDSHPESPSVGKSPSLDKAQQLDKATPAAETRPASEASHIAKARPTAEVPALPLPAIPETPDSFTSMSDHPEPSDYEYGTVQAMTGNQESPDITKGPSQKQVGASEEDLNNTIPASGADADTVYAIGGLN